MSALIKDIKLEIKVEKQDIETQYEHETGDNSIKWNHDSDKDSFDSSATIKKEYDREEDSKFTCKKEDFVHIESVYIKQEKLDDQNENENYNEDLNDYPIIHCKSEINVDIEDHPIKLKDEPILDTETPQDYSASRADVVSTEEKIKATKNIEDKSRKSNLFEENYNLTKDLGGKYNTCEICNKTFIKNACFIKHMKLHSDESPYECVVCKKKCIKKSYLDVHMRQHTGERPYECEICKKNFTMKGHLNVHMRVHSGEKPYECEVCKKTFTQAGALTVHMRHHTGEKPYECDICKKAFTRSVTLITHMRIHNGEKPYECEICLKAFSEAKALSSHMQIHTGERPYECEICKKKFYQNYMRARHMRASHKLKS